MFFLFFPAELLSQRRHVMSCRCNLHVVLQYNRLIFFSPLTQCEFAKVEGRHEIGGRCGSLSVTATWMMADSIPQPGSPVIWTTSIPICTSTLHVMYVWYWYVVKLCLSFSKKKKLCLTLLLLSEYLIHRMHFSFMRGPVHTCIHSSIPSSSSGRLPLH